MAKKRNEVSENYLSELLHELAGSVGSRELWQCSEMDVDEFYKLLRDEVKAGRIVECAEKERLEAGNEA